MKVIAVVSDGDYHCEYYNMEIVKSYHEAVEYFLRNIKNIDIEDDINFFTFNENCSLERIISNFSEYYRENDDIIFDLSELQKYFNIKVPTYSDGTEIKVNDVVKIRSDYIMYSFCPDINVEYYTSKVVSTNEHFVTIKINNIEFEKEHYLFEEDK